MHAVDDVDAAAIMRVVRGRAPIRTLPRHQWPEVFAELHGRGVHPREAAERIGFTRWAVTRRYRQTLAPPREPRPRQPAPAPDPTTPLTRDERRAVLDVIAGRRQLDSLPVGHRWIPVHACRAQGLGVAATARRVRACHSTVTRYLTDPGEGAKL